MTNQSTIDKAKGQIEEVYEALNEAEMERLATWARAWILCLGIERLISPHTLHELNTELNKAMNQVSQRLGVTPLPFPNAGL